jgi:amino acid adenylation domain-containing protein
MSEERDATGFWLSPQQERTWLSGRGTVASLVYLEKPASSDAVRSAVTELVARHEPLRTVFRKVAGMKAPFQMVLETGVAGWREADGLTAATPSADDFPWDLEQGPIFHATYFAAGPSRPAVLLAASSLAADVPSLDILGKELQQLLRGEVLPEVSVRYVQFAQWQRDLLESTEEPESTEAREYWANSTHPPVPVVPGERPDASAYEPAAAQFALSSTPSKEVALAAWQALIWRLTGQAELSIDVFVDCRGYDELKDSVGLIGKYIPVAAEFTPESRFREIIERARKSLQSGEKCQEYFTPPENTDSIAFDWSDTADTATAPAGKLHLSVRRNSAKILFNVARFDRESITRFTQYFRKLLEGSALSAEMPVAALPLLGAEELAQLDAWNQTSAEYPSARCLHELFETQAAKTPDHPAVRYMDRSLTYRELNQEANRLARRLQRTGAGPGRFVALCVDRSAEMIAALLAVVKSGAAFIPLNADNPKPRLAQQLSGISALITTGNFRSALPESEAPVLLLDQPDWHNEDASNLGPTSVPDDLIYVIYTSGSTGLPKGVGVRHRNLVNYAWFIANRLDGENLQFASVSTLSADLGNTCIYPSLISGGCLHVIPQDVAGDTDRMAAYCKQYPVDVLKIVPSHLTALLDTDEGRDLLPRRHLICGGEALTWKLVGRVRELAPSCEIWNHYGPTETTVGSLMINLKNVTGALPIGRPIANTQLFVFNELRERAPIGVAGELYIGGAGVTAGYIGQPQRTAERFIDGMYRTGDLVRFLANGSVEFMGRVDDQVKIRGFRIEPGEIEAVLLRHPSVRQAIVLARSSDDGEKQLVAYLVARDASLDLTVVRNYLKQQLPDYMVPSAFVPILRVPLTANGKIDRQALPSPEQAVAAGREYAPPTTETEKTIAGIWETVMRNPRIGVEDDFFDIGGHSLLATQIASRLREHFHMPVAVRLIFEYPTIRGLANELEKRQPEDEEEFNILPITRSH